MLQEPRDDENKLHARASMARTRGRGPRRCCCGREEKRRDMMEEYLTMRLMAKRKSWKTRTTPGNEDERNGDHLRRNGRQYR
jgi:hypothetical protein